MVRDAAGNLYGTTTAGGASGFGTVFKLDTNDKETVLHSFTGTPDGSFPYAGLILDAAGNLYGTTTAGGASGFGTVFKLDPTDKETVLHSFTGGADGSNPYAGLIRDAAGNLYGTTASGGASGLGTVFKLDTTGKESVLHSFTGTPDGSYPYAGLILDAAGNLYGTTNGGGSGQGCSSGCGTVFKLDTTGKESVLHSFTLAAGEASPLAGLIPDPAGNLYGTTAGLSGACLFQNRQFYCGTVFKLDTTGNESVLLRFNLQAHGGVLPYAGLVRDAAGNLYGTTAFGGAFPNTHGTVFKLDTTDKETVLHSFTGGADGSNPYAGLIRDAAGNLYGTTASGGASGLGTVFKLIP